MTDSNKTLAYENGETIGYFKGWGHGYEDGVIEFAEYLKEHCFQTINVEDDLDNLVKEFLKFKKDIII